jgi:hypothetical protein
MKFLDPTEGPDSSVVLLLAPDPGSRDVFDLSISMVKARQSLLHRETETGSGRRLTGHRGSCLDRQTGDHGRVDNFQHLSIKDAGNPPGLLRPCEIRLPRRGSLIWSDPSTAANLWGRFCCCFCFFRLSRTGPAAVGAGLSDD